MNNSSLVNLIIAIFRLTAQDLKYGEKEKRNWKINPITNKIELLSKGKYEVINLKQEANEFLNSQWFEDLCDIFGTDPEIIKYRIINSPVSWREIYE